MEKPRPADSESQRLLTCIASLTRRITPERLELVASAVSAGVFLVYLLHALVLIGYPWDWSPDEGLFLDYARRLLHAPRTLYPVGTSIPFPLAWTPLLPALLAPIVALFPHPLAAARVLALAWTVAIAWGVRAAVRRRTTPALALSAAALALAPMGLTFWYMLVRMDGLMLALWIWAGVVLVPERLEKGGGLLSWTRATVGAILLVLAFLAKPTAAIHGVPLVLVWLWVDRASGLRLLSAAGGLGVATVSALQIATSGGFLWVQSLWRKHPWHVPWGVDILAIFFNQTILVLAFWFIALGLAIRSGRRVWLDACFPLWVGATLVFPALVKYGAGPNYMTPLLSAMAILIGRWLAGWSERSGTAKAPRRRAWSALACAAVAIGTVTTSRFPLPTEQDRRTAEAFYRAVLNRGRPLLALRPEYAYFLLEQPVEAEGSSFSVLLLARVPGTEEVILRITEKHYRTIVFSPKMWFVEPVANVALRYYRPAEFFNLGYFFGRLQWILLVPSDTEPAEPACPRGHGDAAAENPRSG